MKNLNWLQKSLIIVGIIALIALFFYCDNRNKSISPTTVTVTTPEVKGSFNAVKPTQKDVSTEGGSTNTEGKSLSTEGSHIVAGNVDTSKGKVDSSNVQYIAQLEAENKKLKLDYINASTALQLAMYAKAIQPKEFSRPFEDKNIKGTINGFVTGDVKSVGFDYTLKSQSIEAPIKETYLRFFLGGGVGVNKYLNQGVLKANLSVQNKKGNIYRGSFEKIGSQQFYLAEYDFSVWNWKK